jgi:hypothetical protein
MAATPSADVRKCSQCSAFSDPPRRPGEPFKAEARRSLVKRGEGIEKPKTPEFAEEVSKTAGG